jgi:hypothetical protein
MVAKQTGAKQTYYLTEPPVTVGDKLYRTKQACESAHGTCREVSPTANPKGGDLILQDLKYWQGQAQLHKKLGTAGLVIGLVLWGVMAGLLAWWRKHDISFGLKIGLVAGLGGVGGLVLTLGVVGMLAKAPVPKVDPSWIDYPFTTDNHRNAFCCITDNVDYTRYGAEFKNNGKYSRCGPNWLYCSPQGEGGRQVNIDGDRQVYIGNQPGVAAIPITVA